ncbi:MAG: hypothetical protein MJ137_08955, partial [Clostridia bacterium]|nr:hypothetical protein [Clostridia bacterium]
MVLLVRGFGPWHPGGSLGLLRKKPIFTPFSCRVHNEVQPSYHCGVLIMFDLKDLITKYPECMDNRTK